jgi:3-deoxy-D-manno-octulosonic acid kinase
VWHADLNAHNILVDDAGRIFIVDFDRGRVLPRYGRWARANLARLRRSLEKVHATGRALYYTREGWSQLLKGYAE